MRKTSSPRPGVSLVGLLAFESVARHMNFGRAAAELEVSATAVSRTIKSLEAQLGVRLFNRTTRSVGLTEHGAKLLASLSPALETIRNSMQGIGEAATKPSGLLRINSSYVAFAMLVQPHQAEFLRRFPDVVLEIGLEDRFVDIVTAGFDAGIRLGHAVQRDMVAVPVGAPQQRVAVAAPSYLKVHGVPTFPRDLLRHNCIRIRFASHGRFFEWRFASDEKPATVDVQGNLIYGEMRSAANAACAGLGVAFVFRRFVDEEIRRGMLVPLLESHCVPVESFFLYYPHRAQMPGKLRAFIDFIQSANAK